MASVAEKVPDPPARNRHAKVLGRPMTVFRRMADAIRALALDATERSHSGYPALAMGMADVATALWTRFYKFDAADPLWCDRDRFVLSDGQGALLLYALICLTGHDGMSMDDIGRFRQPDSPAALYPEHGFHPAIETTAWPPGQGLANAVGMAIAERNMAARFGKSLVDHRTWVMASADDMMAGLSHEAASLAGHLALSKLTVLHDEAETAGDATTSEDTVKRFSACGWATKRVDGHDPGQINGALSFALRSKKPTLITCRTVFGIAPRSQPGVPRDLSIDAKEICRIRTSLELHEPPFTLPPDLGERWRAAGSRGAPARRSWLKRLARHNQRSDFERVIAGRLPDAWHEAVAALRQEIATNRPRLSGRAASQRCLEALLPGMPELVGASSGPTGLSELPTKATGWISAGNYGGRYVGFGARGHAMAATATGMTLHGGLVPYLGADLSLTDSMYPALRLSAIMRQRVVYVLTFDEAGRFPGRSIEHLATLRALPNVQVFRPADAMETAECWELALRRTDGPSALVLADQGMPAWRTDWVENRCARGGYVFAEAEGPRQATILATGPEVTLAMAARDRLASDGIAVAVVSLPCWELFDRQDPSYREQVLGGAVRIGVEAGSSFGWAQFLGQQGTFIGVSGPGSSGGYSDPFARSIITTEAVVAAVGRRLETDPDAARTSRALTTR